MQTNNANTSMPNATNSEALPITDDKVVGTIPQSIKLPAKLSSSSMLLHEKCMSLAKAAKMLPALRGGKPPHPSTLYRWATEGRKSTKGKIVYLEICKIGGTNCTSMEALIRFFDRQNDIEPADQPESIEQTNLEKQTMESLKILRHRRRIK
jgi:hypothetical protein